MYIKMYDTLKEYSKRTKKWYPPFIAKKYDVSLEELTSNIIKLWDTFPNPVIKDKILHLDYKGEIPSFYEICDTKYQRGRTLHKDNIDKYIKYNRKEDQHISVYLHDETWKKHTETLGNVKCYNSNISSDTIYLEIDGADLAESCEIALKIYEQFEYSQFMTFYTSGNRSIHIAVDARLFGRIIGNIKDIGGFGNLFYNLAHKIANGARHEGGLSDPHFVDENIIYDYYKKLFGEDCTDIQKVKNKIQTIDPNIYHGNALIRQPNSQHEKSGGWKKEMSVAEMMLMSGYNVKIKKLDKKEIKPYLLHWVFECYESKKKPVSSYEVEIDDSEVIEIFSHIEGFDPEDADEEGWVNKLYSPFYEDTNPAVSVNIESGWYKDFGEPSHSFNMYEFYAKLKGIDVNDVKKELQ